MILLAVLLAGLTAAGSALAQPRNQSFQTYQFLGDYWDGNCFNDIYATAEGGYVLTGICASPDDMVGKQIWLVKTDGDGGLKFNHSFSQFGSDASGNSVIETDNGDYLIGARVDGKFGACMADPDGLLRWIRTYHVNWGGCNAVIELKSGEFILAGWEMRGNLRSGLVMKIESNGDMIWAQKYGGEASEDEFRAMREVVDRGVILAGRTIMLGAGSDVWVVMIDYNGNSISELRYPTNDDELVTGMVSCNLGYAIAGRVDVLEAPDRDVEGDTDFFLLRIDQYGVFQWMNHYKIFEGPYSDNCRGIASMPDDGFVLFGYKEQGMSPYPGIVVRTGADGALMWSKTLTLQGSFTEFNSGVVDESGRVVLCGAVDRNFGLWTRTFAEQNPPFITYKFPEEDEFAVLPGDTVTFLVRAEDVDGDPISYSWTRNDSLLGGMDSTCTQVFPELGREHMVCTVSDGRFQQSTGWLVNIKEFYINAFLPDTLNLTVKRDATVQFSFKVRGTPEDSVTAHWYVDQFELSQDRIFPYKFIYPGTHYVDGMAQDGRLYDWITWRVQVESMIANWDPAPLSLTVPLDTMIIFQISMAGRGGDSTWFHWTLDNRRISLDSVALVNFNQEGRHRLVAAAIIGNEVDKVIWDVNVVRPDGIATPMEPLPTDPFLAAPFPNPFNSETSVRFGLPRQDWASLTLCDIQGRELEVVEQGWMAAGIHNFPLDAGKLPAGMYLLQLQTSGRRFIQKAVVIK